MIHRIGELPHDIRLLILEFADMDTRRYAGLLPKRIPQDRKQNLEELLLQRSVEINNNTLYLRFGDAKTDPLAIAHYQIEPGRITRTRGRVTMRNNQTAIMYYEYEQFKYNQGSRLYEPTLRLSAV